MPNMKLTDITLVVDRSGSMANCKDDAEGGINTFIEDQKKGDGEAHLTLVHFDTEYEFVETATPIDDVKPYKMNPRGATALLDAVGKSVAIAKERIAAIPENHRPGIVFFVIVTDGHENSSVEYNRGQVRKLIEEQQAAGWHILFIGASDKAFDEASSMGIHSGHVAVSANAGAIYTANSEKIRSTRSAGVSGQSIGSQAYTSEERDQMS